MKKINVTFSLPPETHKALQSLIGRKNMSAFVTTIINEALEEKKSLLKKAYIEASKDPSEKEISEEWDKVDDSGDWKW